MPRVKSMSRNAHRKQRRSPHLPIDSPYSSDDDDAAPTVTPTTAADAAARDGGDEIVASSSQEVDAAAPAPVPAPPAPSFSIESPPDAVVLRERRKLQRAFHGASEVSPLDGDVKRKRSPRVPRNSETLAQRLTSTELSEKRVIKIIEELYEEQEQDDRGMYNLSAQTVRETTQCDMSEIVEELNVTDFRRLLTYGEVSAESISETVLPLLKLQADDVFYDLGCGTGKIVVQVALQTPCMVAKGIELMQNRVREGAKALERLENLRLPALNDKDIQIVQGDILKPPRVAPVMDATIVFINNVCFTPELMLKVLDVLSNLPHLKRVVTLRKICERHRPLKCARAGNFCVDYVQPPEEAEIKVSWAHKTSVYLYEKVDYSLTQLAEQL